MTACTKRQDYLGRWLNNANPGTTLIASVSDYVGRPIASATTDYLGRVLTMDQPSAWATGTEYAVGDYVIPKTGTNYDAVFRALDAGTSHASDEPTWPALGGTVVDNAGASQITWFCVHG